MRGDAVLKEKLKIIIKEFHDTELPKLFHRHLHIDLSAIRTPVRKIITIIGPRRAGKTCYLYQVIKQLMSGGAKLTDIIYVNFEDERILPMTAGDLHQVLDAYFELYPGKESPWLFFDEIQNIEGWDKFVRRLNEQGYRIFITGSNSRMLGHEIATALRGRTLTFELFPFSFSEFLAVRGVTPTHSLIYGKNRHKARTLFDEYMFSGGYPEIVLTAENSLKGRILQDYFNTVFYRDLVERYRVKNTELLRQWLSMLMANIAALVSYRKAENDFRSRGIRTSSSTLVQFARYVEDIFFGFMVEMYSESERKRQVNPKKFYFIDHGLHNYLSLSFSENRGRVLENIVFLELRRRGEKVFYHQTAKGDEVDFYKAGGKDRELIQVCYDMQQLETANREKKALVKGMNELGLDSGLVLTMEEKREEIIQGSSIQILPVWEWLLHE